MIRGSHRILCFGANDTNRKQDNDNLTHRQVGVCVEQLSFDYHGGVLLAVQVTHVSLKHRVDDSVLPELLRVGSQHVYDDILELKTRRLIDTEL